MTAPITWRQRLSAYAAAAPRIAWFGAHYAAARRIEAGMGKGAPKVTLTRRLPRLGDVLASIAQLIEADRQAVAEGVLPPLEVSPLIPGRALHESRRFLREAQAVARRRRTGAHQEVAEHKAAEDFPRYYRQNFHFQSDGYLSAESAAAYDFQVEALFGGTARLMRRQAVALLASALRGRDQRKLSLAELGCGTGAMTAELLHAFPRLTITAFDPSPDYLAEAQRRSRGPRLSFQQGFAENIALPDASVDVVVSCYLFHELPPKIRLAAAREIARVLKPGGFYLHADSLTLGDTPALDALLEAFPQIFHEPYYASYQKGGSILPFVAAGLTAGPVRTGFLTKAQIFEKPAAYSRRKMKSTSTRAQL